MNIKLVHMNMYVQVRIHTYVPDISLLDGGGGGVSIGGTGEGEGEGEMDEAEEDEEDEGVGSTLHPYLLLRVSSAGPKSDAR